MFCDLFLYNVTNIAGGSVMSIYVLLFCIFLFILGIAFLSVKKKKVTQLNEYLNTQQYDKVLELCKNQKNNKYLTTYIRDLYCAKALLLKNDIEALKDHLHLMFQTQYSTNDTKQYLTLYYHIFICRKDVEFANEIMEQIKKTEDRPMIQYCTWTKQVLIEGASDLIPDMEQAIENKDYHSFPLAVVVYLIGLQKVRLEEYEQALEYLETALDLFQPTDLYINDVKKEISELIED